MGMTAEDAARRLFRVGIACFIRDFGWLLDAGRSNSNVPAVDFLHETYAYTVAASRTRVPKARKIMTSKRDPCCCSGYLACKAGNAPLNIREKAQKLREERQQEWKIREPFGQDRKQSLLLQAKKGAVRIRGQRFCRLLGSLPACASLRSINKTRWGKGGEFEGRGTPSRVRRGGSPPLKKKMGIWCPHPAGQRGAPPLTKKETSGCRSRGCCSAFPASAGTRWPGRPG